MSPVEVSISIGTAVVVLSVDITLSSPQQPLSLWHSTVLWACDPKSLCSHVAIGGKDLVSSEHHSFMMLPKIMP